MANQPGSQMPLVPQKPRTPRALAEMIAEYVKAFVRLAFWIVVAFATAGAAFLAFRAIIFGCKLVLDATGV
jgi:hypothetical protein